MTAAEPSDPAARWCVLGYAAADRRAENAAAAILALDLGRDGTPGTATELSPARLADFVRGREAAGGTRWVWSDTAHWLPALLAAGVRVERCHDLRLCHAVLRSSAFVGDRSALVAANEWGRASIDVAPAPRDTALFDLDTAETVTDRSVPHGHAEALAEFTRQLSALDGSEPEAAARLGLLLAAESAGALIATELRAAGLPWDAHEHDRILREALGPRPQLGAKPQKMVALAEQISGALEEPRLSIDSAPKLLASLRRAGIDVQSTSRWELAEHEHPAIEPLLHYKKLARLLSANGWAWIDEWVRDGRYRPVYVPGGVVTGRWASSGGGALQLPRLLRPAIRADEGWMLVSADVAQLEPRVLAAMSGDRAMAAAGLGHDLYSGLVESGVVETRQEAKIAVLGAMYGSTTGDAGRLVPRLRRSFPYAMRTVDEAASVGERGGIVSTWLGRSSPAPSEEWFELQARAQSSGATAADEVRARRAARDFGRFTRNFIVQGTAAEWSLAWLADLRLRLARLPQTEAPAPASGPAFSTRAHLAFFLHDEVIVHTPVEQAEAVALAVSASAAAAGRVLFGETPVEFPLDVRVAPRAAKE